MGLKRRTHSEGQPAAPTYGELSISDDELSRLRRICSAFDGATEKVAWGDPTFRVRNKIFAMQKGNYAGGRPSVWIKGAPGAQQQLVSVSETRFFVPPYVGHQGWVGVYLDAADFDWGELESLITTSYLLVAGTRS